MKIRRPVLLLLLAVVLAAAYVAVFHGQIETGDRYPELRKADARIVRRLRELRSVRSDRPGGFIPLPDRESVLDFLDGAGAGAPLAALAVLHEEALERPFGFVELTSFCPPHDAILHPVAVWLGRREDPSIDAILFRMAADSDLHVSLRIKAVAALSRDGHRAALDPLVDLALDQDADFTLRREVLYRLPRIHLPLPPRFRDLLYLPFHRLDYVAAAVFAETGDLEAPSLLAEGLTLPSVAVEALVSNAVRSAVPSIENEDPAALPGAFSRWLDAHPEVRQTEFERVRRAYLESDRRRRELSWRTFEEVAAAPEEELDFAAAALFLSPRSDEPEADLERLWRLSRFLRRDLESVEDPAGAIAILNRRLLEGRHVCMNPIGSGPHEFLHRTLRDRAGNCLGMSTLYLAVCERLDLPVFGVDAPGHVFLRWEDGVCRRNIESQDGGTETTDEEYAAKEGRRIDPSSRERGVFLRSLGKKEMLSLVLSNRAWNEMRQEHDEEARTQAERALALMPGNLSALHVRAVATFQLDPGAESVLADLDAALELHPLSAESHVLAGTVLYMRGSFRAALERIERALEIDAGCEGAAKNRVLCLLKLGRLDEAERAVEAMPDPDGTDWTVQELRLRLRVRRGADGWEDELGSEEAVEREHLLAVAAAEELLDRGEPEKALDVLRRVLESFEASESARASAYVAEGRARVALGDREGAENALQSARERGSSPAETLVLERAIEEK